MITSEALDGALPPEGSLRDRNADAATQQPFDRPYVAWGQMSEAS
jgi:hypothetical protein